MPPTANKEVVLRFHKTNIVRIRPNGDMMLTTGGWFTGTTGQHQHPSSDHIRHDSIASFPWTPFVSAGPHTCLHLRPALLHLVRQPTHDSITHFTIPVVGQAGLLLALCTPLHCCLPAQCNCVRGTRRCCVTALGCCPPAVSALNDALYALDMQLTYQPPVAAGKWIVTDDQGKQWQFKVGWGVWSTRLQGLRGSDCNWLAMCASSNLQAAAWWARSEASALQGAMRWGFTCQLPS